MKRFLVALVFLCIIAAGLWYVMQPPAIRVSAGEFLPDHTLVAIEVHDLEKAISEFKESPLGKKIGNIDIASMLQKMGVEEEKINKYREAESRFFSAIYNKGVMELIGEELHLAFLPPPDEINKPEDLLKDLLIIAYPRRNTDLLELAGAFFAKDLQVKETPYGENTIKSFNVEDDLSLYYCFTEGIMLSSFSLETIKGAIDQRKGDGSNLLSSSEYTGLRRQMIKSDSRTFAYFHMGRISGHIKEIALKKIPQGEEGEKARAIFEKQLSLYDGFKSLGYTSYGDRNESKENVIINLDRSKLTEGQKASYSIKPGQNSTLAMVPSGTILYSWANNLEIKHSLQDYLSREGMTEVQLAELNKKIKETTGATIDEIDETIGGEIGFLMTDIKTGGMFPVPIFAIMAQVTGSALVENFLTSLAAGSGMVFETEVHDGVEIKNLVLPFGSDIQPAYTFHEGFWIVAINPALIKEMMTSQKSAKGIGSEENFKSVDRGLSGKNNSISFMRMDKFAEKMGHLAKWGNNMLTMKSPETAEKGSIVISHLVDPVLEGLKMYKAIGTRTYIEGETIKMDTYCKMESKAL